ncbi:hypothetical protein [Sporomusa sphaeroides]|uniref:Restriction endonuclease domain-containing protein n=1 Tax=Sporomusa sphaeroides DSM 2875 TaxID=1337886 RepID=A0A1U7MA60_9FIRM|nr:hypothetical protein [Sporomusa sphaeroides]OLS54315.1 hypothetical protein SPSPH_45610 [Sporomusa sphaeroides DSM 2875]CVK21544.1 hypothetical protein SSPH_04236 [Sporomusa sphaeroides DSM 2875]
MVAERKKRKSGYMMLQERDLKMITFVAKFGYCNEDHLRWLIGLTQEKDKNNFNLLVNRLERHGYLEKIKLIAKQPAFILLGKVASELLAIPKPKGLVLHTLKHDMLAIDLYIGMTTKYPNYEIKTEREIRIVEGLSLNHRQQVPDLLVNKSIAVEIELTAKSNDRLQQIVNSYLVKDNYSHVLYYVRSKSLGYKIYNYSGRSPKFQVFYFDEDIVSATELPMDEAIASQFLSDSNDE